MTRRDVQCLEHDPEKWLPVFGKDHAPMKNPDRRLTGQQASFSRRASSPERCKTLPREARRSGRTWKERGGASVSLFATPVSPSFVARMERSEIRDGRFADPSLPDCASLHPGYEEIEGSGTPANAGYYRRILRCGARSTERARLTAFHHGSHLRELFHPKGSASGQASWDAVCTGVTRLRLSQSREAPPAPVIMSGD
jgi:hypothetical protein